MQPADPTPLLTSPVIPVVRVDRAADAVALARVLRAAGLLVIEITLRTPAALDAIRAIVAEVPDMILGAGTLVTPRDVTDAVDAGADFLVSPGTPPSLMQALAEAPVPAVPGCSTPTEAMALAATGFHVLKFFPAEPSGGIRWLQAVAEPLPKLRFCPTGGISSENAPEYLRLPNVIAVGGSWVAPPHAVAAGDFASIGTRARAAAALRP